VTTTLAEIARLVGGVVVGGGDDSREIRGVAALDEATPEEISFLGNPKYVRQFAATRAAAVIVPPGAPAGPEGVALIEAENPSYAFGEVVKRFTKALAKRFEPGVDFRAIIGEGVRFDPEKVRIHPGAVILAGAVIGDGSEIGPNAVIGADVKIGRDCLVHAQVSVRERCEIGDRVILQPGAVIGSDGFGYETIDGRHVKIDQIGIVVIEDDVEIGANTSIDRARFGRTIIGAGSKIDNLVQIGHNVRIGEHNLVVSQTGLAGSCRTGKYVVMAAQNGVAGHLSIGDHAVLTGRCGVTTDLEGGQTYGGSPARLHATVQREKAAVRKLPELLKRVARLEKG
jgi:UDP-3-O-[3-hydroxymyristoyl] glucosamine N-acyltransferase